MLSFKNDNAVQRRWLFVGEDAFVDLHHAEEEFIEVRVDGDVDLDAPGASPAATLELIEEDHADECDVPLVVQELASMGEEGAALVAWPWTRVRLRNPQMHRLAITGTIRAPSEEG